MGPNDHVVPIRVADGTYEVVDGTLRFEILTAMFGACSCLCEIVPQEEPNDQRQR